MVLDVLLDREPFSAPAAVLFSRVEAGRMSGYVCATAVTTVYYLATRAVGSAAAREHTERLLQLFEIAPVNRPVLRGALRANFADFEDAVTHEAARRVKADALVTRNLRDFRNARLPIHDPERLLELLAAEDG